MDSDRAALQGFFGGCYLASGPGINPEIFTGFLRRVEHDS